MYPWQNTRTSFENRQHGVGEITNNSQQSQSSQAYYDYSHVAQPAVVHQVSVLPNTFQKSFAHNNNNVVHHQMSQIQYIQQPINQINYGPYQLVSPMRKVNQPANIGQPVQAYPLHSQPGCHQVPVVQNRNRAYDSADLNMEAFEELRGVTRNNLESIEDFGERIFMIVRRAYIGMPDEFIDEYSMKHFIRSLTDEDMALCLEGGRRNCSSFDEFIKIAAQLESTRNAIRFRNKPRFYNGQNQRQYQQQSSNSTGHRSQQPVDVQNRPKVAGFNREKLGEPNMMPCQEIRNFEVTRVCISYSFEQEKPFVGFCSRIDRKVISKLNIGKIVEMPKKNEMKKNEDESRKSNENPNVIWNETNVSEIKVSPIELERKEQETEPKAEFSIDDEALDVTELTYEHHLHEKLSSENKS
jgi:hypothetical protein